MEAGLQSVHMGMKGSVQSVQMGVKSSLQMVMKGGIECSVGGKGRCSSQV